LFRRLHTAEVYVIYGMDQNPTTLGIKEILVYEKAMKTRVKKEENKPVTAAPKKVFASEDELGAPPTKKRRTATTDQKAELAVREKGFDPGTAVAFMNQLQLQWECKDPKCEVDNFNFTCFRSGSSHFNVSTSNLT